MLEWLNQFGLPVKYAIILAIGVPLGRFLSFLLGLAEDVGPFDYILSVIFGGIAGLIVGFLRQRAGKTR
jgi:hypothetical protein